MEYDRFLKITNRVAVGLIMAGSVVLVAFAGAAELDEKQRGERLFSLHIKKILAEKCFPCHGGDPEKLKGGLDLTTQKGLLAGGTSSERVLVPGKPGDSLLVTAILWEDPDFQMPPKENDRLWPEQIQKIQNWIRLGAPWPDDATQKRYVLADRKQVRTEEGVLVTTSGGLSEEWTYRRYQDEDIWSFQPVKRPAVPSDTGHPIDAFVRKKLAEAGLKPSGRADPGVLIRRATYDLTGLPPAPDDVETFLAAWRENPDHAWQKLVDRLLDSPHYGERWGQHWLDVVRYADTSGFSNDWERSNAWRYRDYVIRSFNQDKSYRRFILEQIAGDELEPDSPQMKVAVGFLRMGPWEHTGMVPDRVSRQLFVDDVVNAVGQTFLSTAMRCAKCHDHKFDPLPTRDYYRFYATFAATQPAERRASYLPWESREEFGENKAHVETLLATAEEKRDILLARREKAARQWYAERGKEYVDYRSRLKLPDDKKPRRFVGLTTADEGQLKVREQDVRIWKRRKERFEPIALSVYNGGDLYQKSEKLRPPNKNNKPEMKKSAALPATHIYSGGSVYATADTVSPGVLSATGLPTALAVQDDPYALPRGMEKRRLLLARWIASPENPLTTRSIVNRVWSYHFGHALAGNPNNFGATGKKPTHPGLLDWLASEFVEEGWSLKKLHRLIMTSEVYQQSCDHPDLDRLRQEDPNNGLLGVFEPRRLSAEELRDSMLAVSGELNPQMGGLPIKPQINLDVALAPRMIQSSLAPAYQASRTPRQRNRRSIYAYRIRGLSDPLLEVFNKPNASDSCESRDTASVTPQVFTLMNSEVVTSRSIAMALRLEREAHSLGDRIDLAFRLALGRAASAGEIQYLAVHHRQMVSYHREHEPARVEYPAVITRSVVEELSGDPFEYQERLDTYENYVPDRQASDVSAETRALADVCMLIFNTNEFIFVY